MSYREQRSVVLLQNHMTDRIEIPTANLGERSWRQYV